MRILVLDNHDSFTFNIVALLETLGAECSVIASDAATAQEVEAHPADAILISPGPCSPAEAGISVEVVRDAAKPVFGVCLGHQVVAVAFGATIVRADRPVHGKTSEIAHTGRGIFRGLPQRFRATRYHSLAVERATLPPDLEVTAVAENGDIMALRHRSRPIECVQFHPESILSEYGARLFATWLEGVRGGCLR